MIHFFGILEPLAGKRQKADEAPGKIAFFGPDVEAESIVASREDGKPEGIDAVARERQHFLLQSFSPQF